MRALEPWLPLVLLLLHGFLYNEIGELAANRGVDFGPVVETPLDAWIPFVPAFVIPYTLVWLFPVVLTAYLVRKRVDPQAFRAVFMAVIALLVLCYTLWVLFPVKVGLRLDDGVIGSDGWLGALVRLNYEGASHWNACPSFHVAGPWLLYRCARALRPQLPMLFLGLVLAIMLSTVFIRIHYALDIAFGVLASELVFRQVFRRLHQSKALEAVPKTTAWACAVAVLAVGLTGYAVIAT